MEAFLRVTTASTECRRGLDEVAIECGEFRIKAVVVYNLVDKQSTLCCHLNDVLLCMVHRAVLVV